MIFDVLEDTLLSDMHAMLHREHVAIAGAVSADSFQTELESARARYNNCGQLRLPWIKWRRTKTAVEAYTDAMERRKDPKHRAMLRRTQDELDAETARIAAAVESELTLAKDVKAHRKKYHQQIAELKRRQKRARLSRRRRS